MSAGKAGRMAYDIYLVYLLLHHDYRMDGHRSVVLIRLARKKARSRMVAQVRAGRCVGEHCDDVKG